MLPPSLSAANTAMPMSNDRRQRGRGRFGNVLLALDGGKPLTGAARDGDVADATRQGAPVPFAHLTQPSFGSLIRPDDWPVRSTFNDAGSGKRKLSAAPFLRGRGARPWPAHQLR